MQRRAPSTGKAGKALLGSNCCGNVVRCLAAPNALLAGMPEYQVARCPLAAEPVLEGQAISCFHFLKMGCFVNRRTGHEILKGWPLDLSKHVLQIFILHKNTLPLLLHISNAAHLLSSVDLKETADVIHLGLGHACGLQGPTPGETKGSCSCMTYEGCAQG